MSSMCPACATKAGEASARSKRSGAASGPLAAASPSSFAFGMRAGHFTGTTSLDDAATTASASARVAATAGMRVATRVECRARNSAVSSARRVNSRAAASGVAHTTCTFLPYSLPHPLVSLPGSFASVAARIVAKSARMMASRVPPCAARFSNTRGSAPLLAPDAPPSGGARRNRRTSASSAAGETIAFVAPDANAARSAAVSPPEPRREGPGPERPNIERSCRAKSARFRAGSSGSPANSIITPVRIWVCLAGSSRRKFASAASAPGGTPSSSSSSAPRDAPSDAARASIAWRSRRASV